jgi:hypothetical protein
MGTEEQAWKAFEMARRRWAQYAGSRHIALEELTFVRENETNRWVDLGTMTLGGKVVTRRK